MSKLTTLLLAAATSLGLAFASTAVLAQKADAPKDPKPAATQPAAPKAPVGDLMDLNSASEAELASLKGIGEVRAKAIVKGRPYKGKDDLVSRKIIPKGVYDDIKDQIIARQGSAKKAPAKKA
jgi:competence protein ComEA